MTLTPMECIEKIHQISKDSHLREAFFETVENEIKILSGYLQCSPIEAVLFVGAFVGWHDRSCFTKAFQHFGLEEFQVIKYRKEILSLYDKALLINKDKFGKRINDYDVSQNVMIAIGENLPLKIKQIKAVTKIKDLVDILEDFDQMSDLLDSERLSAYEFQEYIDNLSTEYANKPLFKEIKRLKLDNFETFFLLDTIWDCIKCGDNDYNTLLKSTVRDYYQRESTVMQVISKFRSGNIKLLKKELIEMSKESFGNDIRIRLSEKMVGFLREKEDLNLDNVSTENKKLLIADKLPERKLFYNARERDDIESLSRLLSPAKFSLLQMRLKEKNMPLGIAVLLHGVPGTGKTETVYQLAKQTGRNIFKVDISETKSMWFGESQKIIKKIFSDYKQLLKMEKQAPILLFNEADAIISRRKAAGSTSVADTENAIQNIILEEMEIFEGILFATTNLVDNMDAAFERRFLYKVNFQMPDIKISAKIWKSKLPFLSENEATQLAERYDFSGGEMQNIARKCTTHEILNGDTADFSLVKKYCSEEKWSDKESKKIGF